MNSRFPQVVFGYHGCPRSVGEAILSGRDPQLKRSKNLYDWLGHGVYFWENAPERAMEWAKESIKRKKEKAEPFVIGAVIDLGRCLNLMDVKNHAVLRQVYSGLVKLCEKQGTKLPQNDKKRHNLDCMVINIAQGILRERGLAFDTIRGAFPEGDPIYPGATILEKTHVQICVQNMDCICGYFLPPGIN